jgi:hypothetical protein
MEQLQSASPSEPVARFVDDDAASFLEQLSGSLMVQSGAVNLIGLDSIRDRLGQRWLRRREDVWLYVEKCISRLLADRAYFKRVSETDFVIAIAGSDAFAAQTLCVKVLSETLTHFLGAAEPGAVQIRKVSGVSQGEISCAPVDLHALAGRQDIVAVPRAAAEPLREHAAFADPDEPHTPRAPAVLAAGPARLASATGLMLSVDYRPEPLIQLHNGRVAGLCLEPVVRDARSGRRLPRHGLARLPDSDLAFIDRLGMTVAKGISAAHAAAHSLLVQVSFQTLACQALRKRLLAELDARRLGSAWVIMLSHIDHGTPPSRLVEMISFLHPYCEGVFACIPVTAPHFGHLAECRLRGLVIDLERWAGDPRRTADHLCHFGERAGGLASVLAARGLASQAMFDVARAAGLTHASLRRPIASQTHAA